MKGYNISSRYMGCIGGNLYILLYDILTQHQTGTFH